MIKYPKFKFKFGFKVGENDDFTNIKLVEHTDVKAKYKVLYVLDYIPSADLKSRTHLLSGTGLETFQNILNFAKLPIHNYLICSFHACRTIGQADQFVDNSFEAFRMRLMDIIDVYCPDKIVIFGRRPFQALCPKESELVREKQHFLIGVPFKKELTINGKKKEISVTRSVALDRVFIGDEASLSLLGYVGENLKNAHRGDIQYKIKRPELNIVLIDTIKRFKKFYKMLLDCDVVSIDTETDNLYKIKNRVLTIQFSFDTETSFIIPLCHKDSPFDKEELEYIFEKLRYFFEFVYVKCMIFANAQFDLSIMKTQFKVRYYCSPIWDVFCGAKAFDENLKWLQSLEGKEAYYYSLGNLACQHGDFSYQHSAFGKSDRKTIATIDLDAPGFLGYAGLDTVIPFAIRELQLKRARDIGYKKYESVVCEQMSDIVHSLSTLEYNGYAVDIEYLFQLKFKDSPINLEIDRLLSIFYESDAVKEVNTLILKKKGLPTKALFGDTAFTFQVNKKEHLEMLFFDKLELKPLSVGKNGKGKIDKPFKKAYIDTPEVATYEGYIKATKLSNAYVNQLAKFWSEHEDFKSDRRVRCQFEHLTIVTGRVSAKRPGLQQIPSRSKLGKHIKRLFIAPRNTFLVKVDYRAHEVRGWGIISQDVAVAEAFKVGQELIQRYKRNPSEELLSHIELEGDVHKVNSAFFFGKKIEDVSADDRANIKGIIFGLIYGMMMSSLANVLKRDIEYTEALVKKFMKRFINGGAWFKKVQDFARQNFYIESPLGRRRNLFGYLFAKGDKKLHSRITSRYDRQCTNSPIQGLGSDFMMIGIRRFCTLVWEFTVAQGYEPHIKPCVSVHDSLEIETDFKHLLLTLTYVEQALTVDVKKIVKKRHKFSLISDLEIDYDLGVTTDNMSKWFGDLDELEKIIYAGMLAQNEIIRNKKFSAAKGQTVEKEYSAKEIKRNMEAVFNPEYMNEWMIHQAVNHKPRFLEYKFDASRFEDELSD